MCLHLEFSTNETLLCYNYKPDKTPVCSTTSPGL